MSDERLKKLLKDNAGLGTEATRASIIKTLEQRDYIKRSKKSLTSTNLGQSLIDSLPDIIKDPGMTALWEQSLKEIELGQLELSSFMAKQAQFIHLVVNNGKNQNIKIAQAEGTKICPECNAPMVKRKNEHGAFWGCTSYPKCKHLISIGGKKTQQNGSLPNFQYV